jgi:hypothetical protein
LWARSLPGGLLELDNSPFHAYGLSCGDKVSVAVVDGVLEFQGVVHKSGHRTVRVRFPVGASHAGFVAIWPALEALPCTFEGSQIDRPLHAIDVPPQVDLEAVSAACWNTKRPIASDGLHPLAR